MHMLTIQFLLLLATFGRHRSVIAKSLSQSTRSKDEMSCLIEGDWHRINSSFITSDCTLQCYCTMGGVVSCMDLCPQTSSVQCPSGSDLHEDEVPVGSGGVRCSCKRQYCVPAKVVCYRPGTEEKYKVGETFTLGNCSKSCRCNENGEISCMAMCSNIKCAKGKRPRGKGVIAVGENKGCSCQIQECVAVPRKFCRVDGRRFRPGRAFITKDCRLKCRCKKNGKSRCTPLCKTTQNIPTCGVDKRLADVLALYAGGRCSCENKICLPDTRDNRTELNKVNNLERQN